MCVCVCIGTIIALTHIVQAENAAQHRRKKREPNTAVYTSFHFYHSLTQPHTRRVDGPCSTNHKSRFTRFRAYALCICALRHFIKYIFCTRSAAALPFFFLWRIRTHTHTTYTCRFTNDHGKGFGHNIYILDCIMQKWKCCAHCFDKSKPRRAMVDFCEKNCVDANRKWLY